MIIDVRAVPSASFRVGDACNVRGRGAVITRPDNEARQALNMGEVFQTGDTVFCDGLTAVVTGIESHRVFNAPQGGLLLRGVQLHNLRAGQVWKRL